MDFKAGGGACDEGPAMIYGLYHSAQGAEAQSQRLGVVANNLANAATNAFKRDLAVFQAHRPFDLENGTGNESPHNLNELSGGMSLADVATDFSNGSFVQTGGTYDIALGGPGFLRVSDGDQEFLTRDGRLTVDENGDLVTHDGKFRVQGVSGGTITIPNNATEIQISPNGTLIAFNETGGTVTRTELDQLDIVRPESTKDLVKIGNSMYQFEGTPVSAHDETEVRQGFLEASGSNSVTEMMELIEASRAFETNINMMKFQDESLGRLLQSVTNR
jgi:flagellar basal-body rod protein FlgF